MYLLYGYINKPTATILQPKAKRNKKKNKNRFAQNRINVKESSTTLNDAL